MKARKLAAARLPNSGREYEPNPAMVVLAREARGLSQSELASRLDVSQGTLSKVEAGLIPVSDDLLLELQRVLDLPERFFLQDGSLYGVGVAEIFHRKRADTPKRLLNQIYAQIEIRIRQVAALLRSTEFPISIRRIDVDEYGGNGEDVASLVRATWSIPPGPIQDLTRIAEDAGILIIPMNFGTTKIDAISRWIPGLPPMVFVNQDVPKDRYRFSLAHEIGHIVMHQFPTPDIEQQADAFAAELLCPRREIRVDLTDLKLDRLPVLKRFWKVSMSALIHRAQDVGAITPNRARYLWAQMAKAGYSKREPIELDIQGEQPRLIFELAEAHIDELGFSFDDLRNLVNLNEREFKESYGLASQENNVVRFRGRAVS